MQTFRCNIQAAFIECMDTLICTSTYLYCLLVMNSFQMDQKPLNKITDIN